MLTPADPITWKALFFVAAVVPVALLVYGRLRWAASDKGRKLVFALALAMIGGFGALLVARAATHVQNPPQWDFKIMWAWGKALAEGTNPYDHENLLRILEPLEPDQGLREEAICLYPPWSLLLYAPLGFLPFRAAMAVWYVIQFAVLAIDIWLLARIVAKRDGLFDLAMIAAVVLSFRATTTVVSLGQNHFLLLLALLLFWNDRHRARGGIWLALGVVVKPIVAIVPLYLFVRRRWSALAVCTATGAAICLVTALAFGPNIFVKWREADAIGQGFHYTQTVNQSLLATMLRGGLDVPDGGSPIFSPWFLGIVALMTVVTIFSIARFRDEADDWAVAMTIALALVVYPATLTHYSFHLLIPMMLWWFELGERRGHAAWATLLIAAVFLLDALKISFAAMLLAWIAVGVCGYLYRPQSNDFAAKLID